MTVEELFRSMLATRFMAEVHATEVMTLVKADVAHEPMQERWGDNTEGYPEELLLALWDQIKAIALKWIDENYPKIWYRSMFAAEE